MAKIKQHKDHGNTNIVNLNANKIYIAKISNMGEIHKYYHLMLLV